MATFTPQCCFLKTVAVPPHISLIRQGYGPHVLEVAEILNSADTALMPGEIQERINISLWPLPGGGFLTPGSIAYALLRMPGMVCLDNNGSPSYGRALFTTVERMPLYVAVRHSRGQLLSPESAIFTAIVSLAIESGVELDRVAWFLKSFDEIGCRLKQLGLSFGETVIRIRLRDESLFRRKHQGWGTSLLYGIRRRQLPLVFFMGHSARSLSEIQSLQGRVAVRPLQARTLS